MSRLSAGEKAVFAASFVKNLSDVSATRSKSAIVAAKIAARDVELLRIVCEEINEKGDDPSASEMLRQMIGESR